MIDQRIFEDLQNKIDEEVQVREVNPHSPRSARVVNSSRAKPASKQSRQAHNSDQQLTLGIQELQEIVQTLARRGTPIMALPSGGSVSETRHQHLEVDGAG